MPDPARIPSPPLPALTLGLLLTACSGSGGPGLQDAPPTVVAASFLGATSTPAPGEKLRLFLSEDASLVSGAALDDADLLLSGGATLGNVTQAPTLVSARVVQIILGSGVSFVPNSTTVTFSGDNDAVTDLSGQLGVEDTPTVIAMGDGDEPTVDNLTLNAIDDELNGTGPAGGVLQAPQHLFRIDLEYSDPSSPVDPSKTQVTADVAVSTPAGNQAPGTNLVPFLTEISVTAFAASYEVPDTMAFPAGAVTLHALVVDLSGRAGQPTSYSFQVRLFSDAVRPFETTVNPSQLWHIETGRDVESYTVDLGNGATPVEVTQGPSGMPDFEELLLVIGLQSSTPIPNVTAGKDSNEVVRERIEAEILADLDDLHGGANVDFTFTAPPGDFPNGVTSVPYGTLGFSRICLAGSESATGSSGVLGVAIFDPNNTNQNDNCRTDFAMGTQRLGVFMHTIVNEGFKESALSPFRMTFDPFTPARSGTPVGEDVLDDQRLDDTLNDARSLQIDIAIADISRFAAVVLAHECGHSVGLVRNGAMPDGLYGGDSVHFPGSADGHIRNSSLFPSGATNVMSPALSYSNALSPLTAFNSLNLSYLRERVLYNN